MSAEHDALPPVQYLVMETLAARARLGERYWTFPTRLRPALNALEARGWIWVRSAPTPHLQAWLTDAGRSVALWDGYVSAADRDRATLAAVREWAASPGYTGQAWELLAILDRP